MDREEASKLLRGGPEGIDEWNRRRETGETVPELQGAHLPGADLTRANLQQADLRDANLAGAKLFRAKLDNATLSWGILAEANLSRAELREANLSHCDLRSAHLGGAVLRGANLTGAMLQNAILYRTNLHRARLERAELDGAQLVETILEDAVLTGCSIYGISAWRLKLSGAEQSNLVIAPFDTPPITIDNLEVAQFIYLLLYNQKIRDVINTITSKVVLILGRFTPERKSVLDAIRAELRNHDYCPVMFDFDKPASRSFTETVRTLAHMARFVIADITDAKSIPQELQAIVPTLRVPVQPLLQSSEREYGMFADFRDYSWVLPVQRYDDARELLRALPKNVIAPAEEKAKELERK